MKILLFFLIPVLIIGSACTPNSKDNTIHVRQVVDSIGFAKYDWQMDSIIRRINYTSDNENTWRVVVTPHDDYAYVGDLYPKILHGVKAKTLILFGVAHKARNFNLENKIIFDSFDAWSAPYGNVKVSDIRDDIVFNLPDSLYTIHNEMHSVEHSLEALIPFLQYQNREIEIIPVLVPYMSYDKMQEISELIVKRLKQIMDKNGLSWGKDIALVITTDAVHYGDEDWGGKNYAPYGTDSIGTLNARNHELEIIDSCLTGVVSEQKIRKFINYTVQENDYREYKWTWCGRYSVPFGLLTAYKLDAVTEKKGLSGTFIAYSTSIDNPALKVEDFNMGTTAPANNHHWVGYAAVAYK